MALSGAACGAGPADHEPAALGVALIGAQPYPGQGTECLAGDPEGCGVPIDGDIILRFDRYLKPSSAVRQSIAVYTGSPVNGIGLLRPEYDVIERVVLYRLTAPLEPGTLYTLELLTPSDTSPFGFQAFDGGLLEPRVLPIKFNFFTRRSREPSERVPLEVVPSCERVIDLLQEAGCAAANCHAGEARSMGLGLDSEAAFAATAIGQVAHQTEIGPSADHPLRNPDRFGLQMPIIDPGQPANSYLLYKVMRAEKSFWLDAADPAWCATRYPVALGPTCLKPPESELARLREWFVRGEPMPPEASSASGVRRPHLREIQRFIAGGAICP